MLNDVINSMERTMSTITTQCVLIQSALLLNYYVIGVINDINKQSAHWKP